MAQNSTLGTVSNSYIRNDGVFGTNLNYLCGWTTNNPGSIRPDSTVGGFNMWTEVGSAANGKFYPPKWDLLSTSSGPPPPAEDK